MAGDRREEDAKAKEKNESAGLVLEARKGSRDAVKGVQKPSQRLGRIK